MCFRNQNCSKPPLAVTTSNNIASSTNMGKLQLSFLLAVVVVVAIASADQFSFENYKVWLVRPTNVEHVEQLAQWQHNEDADFWDSLTSIVNREVRIMMAPRSQHLFAQFLRKHAIPNELIIENVEETVERERDDDRQYRRMLEMQRVASGDVTPRLVGDFNHFWHPDEIHQYITELERLYPQLVSTEIIGRSTEGRPLHVVNISLRGRGVVDGSRPIVFIDAGIHAREWVAHHAALYILQQLVVNHEENVHLLENIDLVVLSVVNPDGYAYTRDSYRFWRKTRTPFPINEIGRICYGTDGNRNYEHMWRSAQQTNTTTCHETYPGVSAFSEPETRAVRTILDRYSTDIKLYVSLHTYGNYILYPWGYERTLIDNWRLHDRIGRLFADTILEATGSRYEVNNSAIGLYPAYGGSDDYAAFVGVQAAFTFELTGGGRYGFDLPANRLEAVLGEFWLGFERVLHFAGVHDWVYTTD